MFKINPRIQNQALQQLPVSLFVCTKSVVCVLQPAFSLLIWFGCNPGSFRLLAVWLALGLGTGCSSLSLVLPFITKSVSQQLSGKSWEGENRAHSYVLTGRAITESVWISAIRSRSSLISLVPMHQCTMLDISQSSSPCFFDNARSIQASR